MIIVEYCEYGNIQNILRTHRHQFIDQINRVDDTIDPSISICSAQIQKAADSIVQNCNIDSEKDQNRKSIPNEYTNGPRGIDREKLIQSNPNSFHFSLL